MDGLVLLQGTRAIESVGRNGTLVFLPYRYSLEQFDGERQEDMPIRNVEGAEITVRCASGCKGKRDLREYCQYVLPRGQTKRKLSFGI